MAKLQRQGVSLHYDTQGAGPDVLLTHGYTASTAMWRDNVPALVDAGYRVTVWDMRGHGQSDAPDDASLYSADHTVADMNAVLDAVGAETAIIGGMSLGGYMSLAFNLAHAARIRALMLIDTGPGFKNDKARADWNVYARQFGDRLLSKGAEGLSRSAEAHLQQQDYAGLQRAAYGMLTQRNGDVIHSLPTISVPTLVVVGANDEPYLVASDYMASKIPNATKVVIPDAGHAANVDQPDAFNRAVIHFLQDL